MRAHVTYLIYVSPSILLGSPIMHLSNTDGIKAASMGQKTALVFNCAGLTLLPSHLFLTLSLYRCLSQPFICILNTFSHFPRPHSRSRACKPHKEVHQIFCPAPSVYVSAHVRVLSALFFHMAGENMVKRHVPACLFFIMCKEKIWVYSRRKHPPGPSHTLPKHSRTPQSVPKNYMRWNLNNAR